MPDVPPFDGDKFGDFIFSVGVWSCMTCGAAMDNRRDTQKCGSCKRIADQQKERRMSAAEIGRAINDIANGPTNTIAYGKAVERLADAMDHYISRSSQGWVR